MKISLHNGRSFIPTPLRAVYQYCLFSKKASFIFYAVYVFLLCLFSLGTKIVFIIELGASVTGINVYFSKNICAADILINKKYIEYVVI